MKLRALFIFILILLGSQAARAACLPYQGLVTLHGTLCFETFPGPPNYEDTRHGDKAETYWMLTLRHPVCIDKDIVDSDGVNAAVPQISKIQLANYDLPKQAVAEMKKSLGKDVIVTGSLFGAISAHHHTRVLLQLENFSPENK